MSEQKDDTLLMRLDALEAENAAQEQRIAELEALNQSTAPILLNHARVLQDIPYPYVVVGENMEQAVSRVLARVRALEAENAALRTALEPFAERFEHERDGGYDEGVRLSDLHRAYLALRARRGAR